MTNRPTRTGRALAALSLMALAAPLGACKSERGRPVTHATICNPENDQKRVSLEGYLSSEGMMTFCSRGTCSLSLRDKLGKGARAITVGIRQGGGKNHMEDLPKNFSPKDLKFTTNEGKEIGNMAHVFVTGIAVAGQGCQILDVDMIESADGAPAAAAPSPSANAAAAPSP